MAAPGAVTVPPSCLPNAVKILLADLGHPKVTLFPRLADVTPEVRRSELVYVPLADAGAEYVHPDSELVIHKNVLTRV